MEKISSDQGDQGLSAESIVGLFTSKKTSTKISLRQGEPKTK